MRVLTIEGITITDDSDCFVIAEIGHNHQGSIQMAKEMFRAAKDCGASAVKLQKRDNRTLFTKELYNKPYDHENSFGETYGEHREALEFGESEYRELLAFAKEIGIIMFSTAFDFASADFLANINIPAFKIASADLQNTPLLKHVAKMGKPMIVSTGGGTMDDVKRAHDTVAEINQQLCVMQCTVGYPCEFSDMNLRVISTYRNAFPETTIGLSAHDNGIAMPSIAYVLGARVVEKHFTLNRSMKGTDHAFSLERPGMSKMTRDLRRARLALGDGIKRTLESEQVPLSKMGKKLVAATDLPQGHVLTEKDIAIKTPPTGGLPPYEMENLIGKKLKQDLPEEGNLTWDVVEQVIR